MHVHLGQHHVGLEDADLQKPGRGGLRCSGLEHRRAGGNVGCDAADERGLPIAREGGWAFDRAHHVGHAAQGLHHQIAALPVLPGPTAPAKPAEFDLRDARPEGGRRAAVFTQNHQIHRLAQGHERTAGGFAHGFARMQELGIVVIPVAGLPNHALQRLARSPGRTRDLCTGINQHACTVGRGRTPADFEHREARQRARGRGRG